MVDFSLLPDDCLYIIKVFVLRNRLVALGTLWKINCGGKIHYEPRPKYCRYSARLYNVTPRAYNISNAMTSIFSD